MTPGANCWSWPTTPQIVLGKRRESTRFMTTVPTAISPSRLDRLDSKYIARTRQSRSVTFPVRIAVSGRSAEESPRQPLSVDASATAQDAVRKALKVVRLMSPRRRNALSLDTGKLDQI